MSEPDEGDLPPDPFGPGDPFPLDFGTGGSAGAADPGAENLQGGPFAMFGSMFGSMFGDLAKMIAAQGPLAWDMTRQVALFAANDGAPETNVDPLERIRLEELVRIAEPQVAEAGGLELGPSGGVAVVALTRAGWAAEWLERHRPLLERLASSLSAGAPPGLQGDQPPEALMAGLLGAIGPSLLGMQIGSMAGQLARRHFATYDLALPSAGGDRIAFVPANIAGFAADWSLPIDSLRMRLAIGELTHHAVLRIPHVSRHLSQLLSAHATGFRLDPEAIGRQFDDLDPRDPSSLQRAMSDPQALLGAVSSPQQRQAEAEITCLVTAVEGWAEHVSGLVARRLLGGDRRVDEALRRRRIEPHDGSQLVGRLLGLNLDQAMLDRGAAFVAGIVERAGESALASLWSDAAHLPTTAELEAPGLWLARIGCQ